MKIKTLSYWDNTRKWYFEDIHFFDLTLLVGASGVGKTQILSAISNLAAFANGELLNGVEWEMIFENDGKEYLWQGKTEIIDQRNYYLQILLKNDKNVVSPRVINEKIFINKNLIAERTSKKIIYKGVDMPKLTSSESLINIFQEESDFNSLHKHLKNIVFRDYTQKASGFLDIFLSFDREINSEDYETLENIRNSNLYTVQKLYYIYENVPKIFSKIVDLYKDIFPQIEKVKFELIDDRILHYLTPALQFKETGVNRWIPADEISSGMLRTFLHIAEMYLLKDGTVVLIDEFENSLGVNCINVLTEDLIYENSRLQFIATSHHPYIINKIPYNYWKIITRKGGQIKTHDATDFNLEASNHERFINLINLPQYKRGIESLV
ncbi:MAG: AAA family ATPase [Saprospiraceae bacterium]